MRRSRSKKQSRESSHICTPEQMLDMVMKGQTAVEADWAEKHLPDVVDQIMENYKKYVGMQHLEGEDLPSK